MSSFDFQVENSGRTVQYKRNAQSLRLFGLHSDVNDAHRAGANRLQNKKKNKTIDGKPMEFEWNIFPVFSTLELVHKVRKFMSKMSEPSTIPRTNYLHVDVQ